MRLLLVSAFLLLGCRAALKEPVLTDRQKWEIREAQIQVERLAPEWRRLNAVLEAKVKEATPAGYTMEDGPAGLHLRKLPEPAKTEGKGKK